jgi:integrase
MASIDKRLRDGNVSWRVRYRDPAGEQRNRSFPRKIDAQQFLTSIESSKLTGSYVDPGRAKVTLGSVADRWIAGKIGLRPTTRARYEVALKVHVRPRWGTTPLDRIEYSDVQTWLAELSGSGQSGASVRKSYGVFSAILDLAVRDKRLPANPARGVDLPPVNARRRKYLTARQVVALAEAAALPVDRGYALPTDAAFGQYRLTVFVMAYCGLRWSELAALKTCQVDLLRRRFEIAEAVTEVDGVLVWGTTKSHERRSVPIPRFLADDLMLHLAGMDAEDLVFTGAEGGVMRNRAARRAWFDRAATSIGESGLTPHEMRHTAASLAVSAGANVKAVQRMLGHASAAMTLDIYADLFDDDLDALADRLDAVARAALVSPMCPDAKIVDLASLRQTDTAQ